MAVRSLRYNTFLGRSWKGARFVTDRDALAFCEAAQIYDRNQQKAIVDLVRSLKTAGLWTKMKAIYPFIGGTATSHKWNLKDPRDVDAAFRLTFSGGWTHSSTGAKPNGTNGYADTYLIGINQLQLNSAAVSIYINTNILGTFMIDLCDQDTARKIYLSAYFNTQGVGPNGIIAQLHNSGFPGGIANGDARGFYLSSRTGSATWGVYKNNNKVATRTDVAVVDRQPTKSILLGGNSIFSAEYSSREQSFATIGDGLTDSDASNLYTIVDLFQKRLGRAV